MFMRLKHVLIGCAASAALFGIMSSPAYAYESEYSHDYMVDYVQWAANLDNRVDVSQWDFSESQMTDIIDEAIYSRPEFSYYEGNTYMYKTDENKELIKDENGEYIVRFIYFGNVKYDDSEFENLQKAAISYAKDVATWIPADADTATKAKAIYDYIALHAEYDWSYYTDESCPDASHSANSIFSNNLGVCDGYAKAYKILLGAFGIESEVVYSWGHAWNIVNIDGVWANADVTHDDMSGTRVDDAHFLVSNKNLPNCDGQHKLREQYEWAYIESSPFDGRTFPKFTGPVENSLTFEPELMVDPNEDPDKYALFADTKRDDWYFEALSWGVQTGLVSGYDNGYFGPNDVLTRAQFASMIYRKYGQGAVCEDKFLDVSSGDWYYDAINWCADKGVMVGSDRYFRPNDPISREEMCVVIWRMSTKATTDAVKTVFVDSDLVSDWAKEGVDWAVANGVIQGIDVNAEKYLAPLDDVTRAQTVTMLYRYFVGN